MKILVVNELLEERHVERIKAAAEECGAQVLFYKKPDDIPEADYDADVIYGFAPAIASASKKLKWLCAPWAGVDSLMAPGYFANEECR